MNNIDKLKKLQASLVVFNYKIYNLHWNVKDPHFFELHKNTEQLFEQLSELYDAVAEKIVMHGYLAIGTLQEALKLSAIKEIKEADFCLKTISKIVDEDLTTIISLCDDVKGTNVIQPLLDEIYLVTDKFRWMFKKLN